MTMKKTAPGIWLGVWIALFTAGLNAAPTAEQQGDIAKVKERMVGLFPGTPMEDINPSPIGGIYEVLVGPKVVYVSGDGRFLLRGEIIDLDTQQNLTEPRENAAQTAIINQVKEEDMIIFGKDDAEHTITIFTDIDCGYCRKLHGEMEAYNDAGIRIRYLFFPRAGVNSDSYQKAVSVWCADDRHQAMTKAKAGEEIEKKECKNPVQDHMALGQLLGVRGTPALYLEDGRSLPGYIPAARLSAFLKAE